MLALGFAIGGLAALPFARWARRASVGARVRPLRAAAPGRPASKSVFARVCGAPVVGPTGRVVGGLRARRRQRRADVAMRRELPVLVDLVAVALAAGCTPYLAIEHAAGHAPRRSAEALRSVLRRCALGQSLDDALRDLAGAHAGLRPLAEALRTSARLGAPATPALARLADDVRADLRRRAEARARTVPVRLCFPLVACILPAFALLTVAPVVFGGLRA